MAVTSSQGINHRESRGGLVRNPSGWTSALPGSVSATPTADTQEVTLQNDGEEPHALVFARINEGFTLDEAFELQGGKGSAEEVIRAVEAQPGQSKTAQVEGPLEPGSYAMVCPVETEDGEFHFDLGQRQEFEIE